MNLTKVEKAIIAILVIGAILGFGIFLFAVPAFNNISKEQRNLDALKAEQARLNEELAREATIDTEITDAKALAEQLEGSFYPDLTTYETSEITMAYLKDLGFDVHGINVSAMGTQAFSLQVYNEVQVYYDLKSYAKNASGEIVEVTEGTFVSGGKTYTIEYTDFTNIVIKDADGNEIKQASYTEDMIDVYQQTLCRIAASTGNSQVVGVSTASVSLNCTYGKYLEFIDYINSLDRATMLTGAVIPMTMEPIDEEKEEDEDGEGSAPEEDEKTETSPEIICTEDTMLKDMEVTIYYFSVEPMKALDSLDVAGKDVVLNQ